MKKLLKVYTAYTEKGKSHPQIILQGEWVKKLGFSEGDYVALDCKEGVIRIVDVGPIENELDD